MARRGPPAIPTQIKLLNGNPSRRPLNGDEPQPTLIEDGTPPEWLDERAKARWLKSFKDLQTTRVITESDYESFARLCYLDGQFHELREKLCSEGLVTSGLNTKGKPYQLPNPLFYMMLSIAKELSKMEQQFGMTPSSRTGLRVTNPTQSATSLKLFGPQVMRL